MLGLFELLSILFLDGSSPAAKKPSTVTKAATWLLIFGLLFLGFTAKYHLISLLRFGLYCLAALLLACGVAYALFRVNITSSYKPSEFALLVTALAVWFVGTALWLIR